ncbi:MAG: amidase [Verrucomicrobia bacterium]|nr:amidase [Verrucomicrobiota bacterium]MBV8277651.1 amidase [Verrucomicrobiota bacterium]
MAPHLTSRRSLLSLLFVLWFSGCTTPERRTAAGSHHHDFIVYWPVPAKDGELCLAVKDNIDIKGVVTTAGSQYVASTSAPAAHDAACLAIARERHVRIVGKTNLSELTLSPSGINDYYGTPRNPFSKLHQIIPGGSSSGSAASVKSGLADITFGTDTAGSIRVPAACCGIVGLKTTFGLVSLKGVFPVEPKHLDTVGPMAKDIAHTVQGMDLLEKGFAARYAAAVRNKPLGKQIRIGRLYLSGTDPKIDKAVDDALTRAGFQVVPLDQAFKAKWDAAKKDGNTVAAAAAWMSDQRYGFRWGVRARTTAVILLGRVLYPGQYRKALERRPAWQHALHEEFKKVDLIALPTLQTTPPAIPWFGRIALLEARVLNIQNTVPVNLAGNPALAVPVPLNHEHFPMTSLQLIGPRLSEAELLNAGRIVEASRY